MELLLFFRRAGGVRERWKKIDPVTGMSVGPKAFGDRRVSPGQVQPGGQEKERFLDSNPTVVQAADLPRLRPGIRSALWLRQLWIDGSRT